MPASHGLVKTTAHVKTFLNKMRRLEGWPAWRWGMVMIGSSWHGSAVNISTGTGGWRVIHLSVETERQIGWHSPVTGCHTSISSLLSCWGPAPHQPVSHCQHFRSATVPRIRHDHNRWEPLRNVLRILTRSSSRSLGLKSTVLKSFFYRCRLRLYKLP